MSPGYSITSRSAKSRALGRGDRVDHHNPRMSFVAVHESAFGTKRTCPSRLSLSAFGGKADIASKADIRTGNSSFFPFRYSDLIGAFPTSSAAVFLPEGKSRPRSA